jgi:hypothetical protein
MVVNCPDALETKLPAELTLNAVQLIVLDESGRFAYTRIVRFVPELKKLRQWMGITQW